VKRFTLFLAPLALLAQQAAVPPASYTALKFPALREIQIPKIEETTLPNGMKVYLLENHELPTVRGTALVRTGNLFDPADKVGLAGITGDAIRAGGTSAKSGDQLDEELENIAASVESSIGESFGTVSFSTLKERTDEVLGIFHDVLTDPAFRDDKIELAKSQTRSGISRRNDEAHGITQREFANILYGRDNSYGWDIQYATIDAIHRDDVEAFYKRYFFPSNVILAIHGDFNAAEMKAKLEKLFAAWTVTQPPVPPFPPVTNQAKPGVYLATKTDVTQTSFAMGHLAGILKDKDYPALEVMSDILGGGFKSRLFQKVRTQLGYAYEVDASWGANYDHPGLFIIAGSTKSASTVDTIKAIDAEVQRIRTSLVTDQELETARQTVANSFIFNFDTPAKTLNRLLTYRYFGYPDDFIFQYQKAIAAVTREDILRVAKQYIDPARFVIVATGNPKDFGKPLSGLNLPVSDIDLTIPEPGASKPAAANPASLESGRALLAKLRDAMGGEAKIAAVKDFDLSVNLQLDAAAGGLKVSQNQQWLAPSLYRQENILPFGTITTYSDGVGGWSATPQGVMPVPPPQIRQIAFENFRLWFSLLMSDKMPNRTVSDLGGNKLRIADDAGHSVVLTIDPATGLPAQETYAPPENTSGSVDEIFSDWRDTGGVKLPWKITLNQAGKHFADAVVTSATLNKGITVEQISAQPAPPVKK
jgi:zinc protease